MNPVYTAQSLSALITDRELQIIQEMSKGRSSKQIAAQLGIATNTVEKHRSNIFKKTGCSNAAEVVTLFVRSGTI